MSDESKSTWQEVVVMVGLLSLQASLGTEKTQGNLQSWLQIQADILVTILFARCRCVSTRWEV